MRSTWWPRAKAARRLTSSASRKRCAIKYGKANEDFLRARRLVEAGISVVTLVVGGWDTHSNNFNSMRSLLPRLDQGVHALVTDLEERGLSRDVAVIVWGNSAERRA